MSNKIKCTCGHSWNKSSSSKKDMNICHICGKDTTMQMGGFVYPVNYVPQKKNGGWLDAYEDDVPEAQNGIEGTMGGLTDIGFNYNGAWGGPSAQNGLTFLEPTSRKLPMGHVIPMSDPSTELAISVGGEDGEPAYLIPSFKYGKYLIDKDAKAEFRKTGEHLGGPFKTWQEADEWERTVRHPYVEKGQSIPTPFRRWGKDFAMGGSLPGSVGFTYERTKGIPSEGPYAKKTLASAQPGIAISDNTRTKPIITDRPLGIVNRESVKSTEKQSYRMSPQEALLNKLKGVKLKESQDRLDKTAEKITAVSSFSPNPLISIPSAIGNFALGASELDLLGLFGSTPSSLNKFKQVGRRAPFFKAIGVADALSDIFEFTPSEDLPKRQNGGEMKFYQEGLDWKPRNISRDGSEIPQAQLGLHMLTPDYNQVGENIMEMLSVPQKALTKLFSGKYQAPSEALGIKNKVGAIATDILLDPANLVGGTAAAKIAKGVKAAKAVNKVDQKELVNVINKNLAKGMGVKKQDIPLSVKLMKDEEGFLHLNTYLGDELAGNINLRQNQVRPKTILENIIGRKTKTPIDKFDNTVGYSKYRDYPFGNMKHSDDDIVGEFSERVPKQFLNSGISGEFNKAINETLKSKGLGNLLSDRSGLQSSLGKKRWEKLVEKGLAENIGNNLYKMKRQGGSVTKDDNGYWNPENWGKPVEIGSNEITMKGLQEMGYNKPLLGISDTGDVQMMYPGEDYTFDGESVTEYPVMQKGGRTPIYTENPKDKRIKAYQDSLSLYNKFKDAKSNYINTITSKGFDPSYIEEWTTDGYVDKDVHPKIGAIKYGILQNSAGGFDRDDKWNPRDFNNYPTKSGKEMKVYLDTDLGKAISTRYPIYKKPVQPVKYKKPQPKQEVVKKQEPTQPPIKKEQPKPIERKQNIYEGSPVYSPGVGSGMPSALIGFLGQQGDTTYIKPEDYERFAVPKYGKEFIESKTKKKKNGGWLEKWK